MSKTHYYFDTTDERQIRVSFDPERDPFGEEPDTDDLDYGDGWRGQVVPHERYCDLSSANVPEAVEKAHEVARDHGLRLRESGRRMGVAGSE